MTMMKHLLITLLSSTFVVTMTMAVRHLEIGDFDALNEMYANMVLPLPDTAVEQDLLGSTLNVALTNIVCTGFNIGDIQVNWKNDTTPDNNIANLEANVTMLQIDLDCTMAYEYSYLFFNGVGVAAFETEDNQVSVGLTLAVDHSASTPVAQANITDCVSSVTIASMEFNNGDGLGAMESIMNSMQDVLDDLVKKEVESVLCQEFSAMDEQLASGMNGMMNKTMGPYLSKNDQASSTDPLQAEQDMLSTLPDNVLLLDFQNQESTADMVVNTIMGEVTNFLSKVDETGEPAINKLLRSSVLEEDGSLTLDLEKIGMVNQQDGGALVKMDHMLGSFSVKVTSAKILGLDSFSSIDPLAPIGQQTLQTNFTLDEVKLQLGLAMTIEGASPETSYTEDFDLEWTLSDVSGSIAVLLAIDANQLGQLRLGALMAAAGGAGAVDDLASCFSSALYDVQLTQFTINSMELQTPTVSGLESPGLNRVMTEGLGNIFAALQPMLQVVLPEMIATMANDFVGNSFSELNDASEEGCRVQESGTGPSFMDFRDFFLTPSLAKEYGGSGTEPYGSVALLLKDFVDEKFLAVDPSTGLPAVSRQIMEITQAQSGVPGSLSLGNIIDYDGKIDIGGFQAGVVMKFANVSVENLHALGEPLALLEPVRNEAYMLNNTATWGVPPTTPVRLAGTLLFQVATEGEEIRNELNVGVDLHSAQLLLTLFMKMLESDLMNFPLADIFNYHCWLSTIPAPTLDSQGFRTADSNVTLSLAELAVSISQMNFTVDCIECSGSKFQELALLFQLSSTQLQAAASAQSVLNYALSMAKGESSFLQTEIDRMLVDAPKFCPHRPEYSPTAARTVYEEFVWADETNDSATFLVALIVAMALVAVGAVLVSYAVKFIVGRRHRMWLESLPKEQLLVVYENQQRERDNETLLNAVSKSMFTSKQLPCFLRWFVPVVLLGNIALFLSGHLSLGGAVVIYIQVGGETIVVNDFYTFSIAQSGVELWNAGAKEISILMLLFSGVWPYTKVLITLVLWFLPPRFVSLSRRSSILLWLDFLAKWSMIDVFVMMITIAAFRVTIESPDVPFLPDDLYQVDLLVVPMWGLYANMCAQLLTQITSHVIIYYHRVLASDAAQCIANKEQPTCVVSKVEEECVTVEEDGRGETVESDDEELGKDDEGGRGEPESERANVSGDSHESVSDFPDRSSADEREEPLRSHAFTRPHRGESEKLWIRSSVNPGVIVLSLAIVVLVLVGCILPSFSYDYRGLVGVAIETGMGFEQALDEHSVISVAQLMMDEARFLDTTKDYVGLASIAIVLVLTTLVVPVLLTFVLVAEWFLPMRRVVVNRLRVVAEILSAWQYMEVFLLSLIVGAWQIGDVSEFLVNSYCDNLMQTFSTLVNYGVIAPEDAQCFRVQAAIESASYILITAAVLLLFLSSFVSQAVFQRARDEQQTGLHRIITSSRSLTTTEDDDDVDDDNVATAPSTPIGKITPVPVLFTDQFRWLLTAAK